MTTPHDDNPVLDAVNVTVSFAREQRRVDVVRGVNLRLAPGEAVVVVGESGSGKSAFVRALMALNVGRSHLGGTVNVLGTDVLNTSAASLRGIRGSVIAMIAQDPSGALDPVRTVRAQLIEMLHTHHVVRGKRATLQEVERLLTSVGFANPDQVGRSYAHELSGGMRQRVAIALAVSCSPAILLADEPSSALDATIGTGIIDLLNRLRETRGTAMVFITHDMLAARRVAHRPDDRVAVMYAGRVVEFGRADRVLKSPSHPYTQALLAAAPNDGSARGALPTIAGQPPTPGELPTGCPFRTRCPLAIDACAAAEPALVTVVTDHLAACIRATGRRAAA